MFFRTKPSGARRYLQIVENTREGTKTRQRVLATLGRVDELAASGKLDALLRSGARLCESAMVLSSLREGNLERATARRIGAPLVFERLWRESGCQAVIEELLEERGFGFPVERAVFATVLHRLMVSGSDRACERWMAAYRIEGAEGIELHHLYRAMKWLGEELADQSGATRGKRRVKDLIEERLFQHRRSLFSDLSIVLFDTTSLYFYGRGGVTLGRRGKSKDHRPDLHQVIVGLVLDEAGRPICSETWPGNVADVTALLPVVERLRARFGLTRMCVVADRGMISAATLAALEARGIESILGARERWDREVREVVLADDKPMVALTIPRARDQETTIEVKEVVVGEAPSKRRYVVCFNPEQARRDAETRAAILQSLEARLEAGEMALVGNAGYRRFLARKRGGRFAIDPARVAEDARFDGLYVLRTNSTLDVLSVALAYRQLWRVEQIFRTAKAILDTRPIYHQRDSAIVGHLFCSFLALVLRKALDERLDAAGVPAEWADIRRDLDRLEEVTVEHGDKRFLLRLDAEGTAAAVCRAVGVALPPGLRQVANAQAQAPPAPPAPKTRRGRPRRGATRA